MLIHKKRNLLFPVILLIGLNFINRTGWAQLSPEPLEGFMAGQANRISSPQVPGMLFYLSGNKGFTADFAAGGQVLPNYLKDVEIIPSGVHGPGFSAEDSQLLSYWAPGNIYAQRGTVSFFWRSRYPAGPTPFPVFRVGFADHSSWDMVWLRIDYNGSDFDAFVTDIGLTRTRISYFMDQFPAPDEWIHLALSWDETEGIRFYVNGELVSKQSASHTVYDAGLDQFGPHSRIISPYQVQSAYSFKRGGDLDELRIYDRMLPDESIPDLFAGKTPKALPPLNREMRERRWRDAWWMRHGWNLPNPPPPVLPSSETRVRKVEIWGKAWGQLTFESGLRPDFTFAVRSRNQVKSYHRLPETKFSGKIRFDNALIEEPIGSFEVYYIDQGHAPGTESENFTLVSVDGEFQNKALEDIASFIRGRYPADERTMMLGVSAESDTTYESGSRPEHSYPFIHIMIPYTDDCPRWHRSLKRQRSG